jgi:transcriptional regulator with XRE-family HTH domain
MTIGYGSHTMLQALMDLQKRQGLSDRAMAEGLGCSRPYWNLIRNGKRDLPHRLAVTAAGTWPELTRHLLDLAESSVTSRTDTPERSAA